MDKARRLASRLSTPKLREQTLAAVTSLAEYKESKWAPPHCPCACVFSLRLRPIGARARNAVRRLIQVVRARAFDAVR